MYRNKWVIHTGLMDPPVYRAVLHDKNGEPCEWLPWEKSRYDAALHIPEDGHDMEIWG